MNFIETIYALGALASALAACLAWVAKLHWSKEFSAAKDATIQAKDAEIETLKSQKNEVIAAKDAQIQAIRQQLDTIRELTPAKIREYLDHTRSLLEEYVDQLKNQLAAAQQDITEKETRLRQLAGADATQRAEIEALKKERDNLDQSRETLSTQVAQLEKQVENSFTLDFDFLKEVSSSSEILSNSLSSSRHSAFKPADWSELKRIWSRPLELRDTETLRVLLQDWFKESSDKQKPEEKPTDGKKSS